MLDWIKDFSYGMLLTGGIIVLLLLLLELLANEYLLKRKNGLLHKQKLSYDTQLKEVEMKAFQDGFDCGVKVGEGVGQSQPRKKDCEYVKPKVKPTKADMETHGLKVDD